MPPTPSLDESLQPLIQFFETLCPATVPQFATHYASDACFKDPFNEVRGLPAIERIFRHMFEQLDDPRFIVTGRYVGQGASSAEAMLRWELRFHSRLLGPGEQHIVGSTLLAFDRHGRVTLHRDYWDASEELFSKLPLIGPLTRTLRRKLSSERC